MTSVDPVTGSNLLRHLRESRGWSWADLARALRETAGQLAVTSLTDRRVASIQRTVARWESPTDSTSPGERYQYLLAHLYARTASGTFALGPGSDFAALLDALRHFGSPEHRIRHLVEAVTRTAATSGGVDGDQASMPDEALVRQLADQVSLAVVGGQDQQGVALRVGEVGRHAGGEVVQQQRVTGACEVEQGGELGQLLGAELGPCGGVGVLGHGPHPRRIRRTPAARLG